MSSLGGDLRGISGQEPESGVGRARTTGCPASVPHDWPQSKGCEGAEKRRLSCVEIGFFFEKHLPSSREEGAIGTAKGADGDTQGHEPSEGAQYAVAEGDGDRLRIDHLLLGHGSQIGDVDQCIAQRDQRYADHDRARQVLAGILDLLGDIVEIVPAIVCPEASVKCRRNGANIRHRPTKCIRQMLRVALEELPGAAADHNDHGHQFGRREDVLHGHAQIDAVAIDEEYHHWNANTKQYIRYV